MKKILLLVSVGLMTVSTFAQKQQNRHEFSIWAAGGISTLQYDLNQGERGDIGIGGLAGIGYSYFFNYNWSLTLGAEASYLQAKALMPVFSDTYLVGDAYGYLLSLDFNGKHFADKQQAYYLNIPLIARFQIDAFKNHKFYVGVGPKVGFTIPSLKSSTSDLSGSFTTSGLEVNEKGEALGQDPFVNMPHHGFGNYSVNTSKDIDFGINVIGSIETGIKWVFSNKTALYTGLFFDYGFIDIRKDSKKNQNLYNYNMNQVRQGNTARMYEPNSILYSKFTKGGVTQEFTDKVNTMAAGLKIQFSFGIKPFAKKEKVTPEDKPFEGVTPDKLEELLDKNTNLLIEAQQKEFAALKAQIEKNDPELLAPVTISDDIFLDPIVGFENAKNTILTAMIPELEEKVRLLNKYPNVKLTLIGHTDNTGGDELNVKLGYDRAEAAKRYLVNKGISPSRLFVETRGKSAPALPNTDAANKSYNRRVEFELRQ